MKKRKKTIKNKNQIQLYEINGKETKTLDPKIEICSHWNRNVFVVIDLPEDVIKNMKNNKLTLTCAASDLIAAIKNATNTGY